MVQQWQFDAVIVDGDGHADTLLHLLPELRDRAHAPIVVVWSDGGERRQIEALQVGATEVIVKPASPRLIAAKLHRLIESARTGRRRRRDVACRGAARAAPPRSAPRRRQRRRHAVGAHHREFELLLLLASRPGEFVHRETIGPTLGSSAGGAECQRGADMHICRIRRKLRDAGAGSLRIETVYGRGYCLRLEREETQEIHAARHPLWSA